MPRVRGEEVENSHCNAWKGADKLAGYRTLMLRGSTCTADRTQKPGRYLSHTLWPWEAAAAVAGSAGGTPQEEPVLV